MAGVPEFTHFIKQAQGGAGQMTDAATAPRDLLSGLSDGRTTYHITCTKPLVGVSPFLFRPPDEPAAVGQPNTPSVIAWMSLIQ